MQEAALKEEIIGCAMRVHQSLGIETGLLLNFGASSLQVKRKYRTYRAKGNTARHP